MQLLPFQRVSAGRFAPFGPSEASSGDRAALRGLTWSAQCEVGGPTDAENRMARGLVWVPHGVDRGASIFRRIQHLERKESGTQ